MGLPLPMDSEKYMSVRITTVAKALPPHSRATEDILPFLDTWLAGQDSRFQRKVSKIFENAAVDQRYSIMSPEEVFTQTTFEEKNLIYRREVVKLGEEVVTKALAQAKWKATYIDYFIPVSCTGMMIPSVDAFLINKLQMRQDVVRLPVTEMGCVAGVSGIIYAKNFLQSNPGKRAAVLAIEAPTATFQLDDYSMANIVSAAIFGDGAACVLLSSDEADDGPEILDQEMYHFYDSIEIMGFDLTNSGLQMVLDKSVPETIAAHFSAGGKKIVETVEALFGQWGKNLDDTREVLRQFGNMSSATVLYVLERFMNRKPESGSYGLMLSFGPGFTAQRVLLRW